MNVLIEIVRSFFRANVGKDFKYSGIIGLFLKRRQAVQYVYLGSSALEICDYAHRNTQFQKNAFSRARLRNAHKTCLPSCYRSVLF